MHTNEIPVCLERVNMVGRITEKRRRACDIFCLLFYVLCRSLRGLSWAFLALFVSCAFGQFLPASPFFLPEPPKN